MQLRKLGILAPLLWVSLIAIAGTMRPDFSHLTDYISELAERGSATESLMRYAAFGFTGFLYLCFAATLRACFREGWLALLAAVLLGLDGLGRIGAGVFPCDPGCNGLSVSQGLHREFATLGFLSGILAAIAWGVVLRRHAWPRSMAWHAVATGVLALTLLLLMSWDGNPVHAPGLFEHLASGVLSLWVLAFAASLLRDRRPSGSAGYGR